MYKYNGIIFCKKGGTVIEPKDGTELPAYINRSGNINTVFKSIKFSDESILANTTVGTPYIVGIAVSGTTPPNINNFYVSAK